MRPGYHKDNVESARKCTRCGYNWAGSRSLPVVTIEACGLLKKGNVGMDESQILFRALRDVNVPKFLRDDLPFFENIISDIFPTTERPVVDHGSLSEETTTVCKQLNLPPVNDFTMKVIQLLDTLRMRHGMMLVGPTGGGKM